MSDLIILGIDGLDIKLIENLDLQGLKQIQYGELEVPISSVSGYPRSPSVWASFLIGKEVEIEFTRGRVVDFVLKTLKELYSKTGKGKNLINKVQLEYPNVFKGLKEETFLDWERVEGVNVPYRNHDPSILRELALLQDTRLEQYNIEKMIEIHQKKTREILRDISMINSPIVFGYIQTLDILEHYFFTRHHLIERIYRDLEREFIGFKNKIGHRHIIIVSDHGFNIETGYHSLKGFYSTNIKLNPIPQKITDFYKIIMEEI